MRLIGAFIILLLINTICYAGTLILPKELMDGAKILGFSQVDDFYNKKPGMVDPCYVYGCLPGDKELSALFWGLDKNSKKEYALILMQKKNILDKGTFNIVYQTSSYPRGLSINKVKNLDLTYFHYLPDKKRTGKGETLDAAILIYDMYDGVGSVFCFNNGNWMITQYD